MTEQLASVIILVGLLLSGLGFLGLVVRAWSVHWLWGLGLVVLPPLAPFFAMVHRRRAAGPGLIVLGGLLVAATPIVINRLAPYLMSLGPYESLVDGERHLTLTGWDRDDYEILRSRPDVVVLQMANPDVTDATLAMLRGFSALRELDLSDTAISDDGLAVLATLPALRVVRLTRTAITADGFERHLAPLPELLELDLRQTDVPASALRAWKKQRPDERRYLR